MAYRFVSLRAYQQNSLIYPPRSIDTWSILSIQAETLNLQDWLFSAERISSISFTINLGECSLPLGVRPVCRQAGVERGTIVFLLHKVSNFGIL